MTEYHILNLGAGVQSTTEYIRSVRGESVQYDYAIFADTGEEPGAEHRRLGLPDPPPSESVYAHLDWLKSVNGPPILVHSIGRLGDDLEYGQNSTGQRFASTPAFTTANEGVDIGRTRRQCSKEYKTEVIEKAIRTEILHLLPRKRIPKDVVLHQYFGISLDERSRATRIWERFNVTGEKNPKHWKCHFPLLEAAWTRANCLSYLEKHCPHQVPRSACTFCPFHDDAEWLKLKEKGGPDWQRLVHIDRSLRTTGTAANRLTDQVMYLHRTCRPIDEIDFKPKENVKEKQLGFAYECEGVCGV